MTVTPDRDQDTNGAALLRGALETLARAAARAPSPGNSQPWRFRLRRRGVELLLDRDRLLSADETGVRQGRIACGAALLNLRLAVGQLGVEPVVCVLPDEADPDLIARVELGALHPQPSTEARLLAASVYRHTHRDAFDPVPLPEGLLADLVAAAAVEGAALLVLPDAARRRLDAVVADVDARTRTDALATAGLRARWVPAGAGEPSVTAVLATVGDDARAHVAAGLALERVLLTAAPQWVFARIATKPLERPRDRARVRGLLRGAGSPQLLMQLGRASYAPVAPRRPVVDALAR